MSPFIAGLLLCTGCATTKWTHFGEPMKVQDKDAISACQLLGDPDSYIGETVRIKAQVKQVCESRGCWMMVGCQHKKDAVLVKFGCPIQGRLIPMAAVGQPSIVEGKFDIKEISEAEARHYKKDEGGSPAEIAKIVGPQKMPVITSYGALVDMKGPPGCCDR